jgi:hypothetical protein
VAYGTGNSAGYMYVDPGIFQELVYSVDTGCVTVFPSDCVLGGIRVEVPMGLVGENNTLTYSLWPRIFQCAVYGDLIFI